MASTSDPADRLPLTPATFQILLSLTQGALHRYGIERDVEERTGGMIRLGAGTLYAGRQRMEDDGLIEEAAPPGDEGGGEELRCPSRPACSGPRVGDPPRGRGLRLLAGRPSTGKPQLLTRDSCYTKVVS